MVEVEPTVETSVVSGVDYEGALATIYSHTTSSFSSSGPSGSSTTSLPLSTTRQSPTLDALLSLLSEASQSDSPSNRLTSFSQRMRIADSICTFLAGTVTKVAERKVIVNGARGKEACVALTRLAETGSDKVCSNSTLSLSKRLGAHVDEIPGSRRSAQSINGDRARLVRRSAHLHRYVRA